MEDKNVAQKYVAFLRGINVGGHHKVPMVDLKKELHNIGFKSVITLLNSGNVIFNYVNQNTSTLEEYISKHLSTSFGFNIPIIVRKQEDILELAHDSPFSKIELTKNIKCYVSFLRNEETFAVELPWKSADNSYQIIAHKNKAILSVLDLSISKTTKAMEILDKHFGKDITTRNWNTIERILKKINT
ncbi:DUF1697 domain-containing protein [Aquimarina sp. 2201CG14-23]|uniref:DUF1697 domain-containing protein n=1 Tax=Aquimarina mycalae TaxID=3040073 RepID=UPI002478028A|nr:DUF1697 domain-containing protein [Aquimarina sp. 2201CG14-23]MDH7446530.1 DUF1697 domain-containing protein [Aquimarina sp. 2201CG14-23]